MTAEQELKKFENSGKYLFHGSGIELDILEPNQAFNFIKGKKIKDGRPSVHATHFYKIACFMAIMTKINFAEYLNFGYIWSDNEVYYQVDRKTLNKINKSRSMIGYVYVLKKDNFFQRNETEWIATSEIKPYKKIRIGKSLLPKNIEIF